MSFTSVWPFRKSRHDRFEQLIQPHLKQLYQLAYRYTGEREDAEDLVQDLLLKLYPRLDEMQQIERLDAWLKKVLYRQFVDMYRRNQRSPIEYSDEDYIYDVNPGTNIGPDEATNTELTLSLLEKALNRLKEEQRILVLLHDVEGYGISEISEMIDVPTGTIKSRLSRSRKKLQEILRSMEPNVI